MLLRPRTWTSQDRPWSFPKLVRVVGKKSCLGDTHIPQLISWLIFWHLAAVWGPASARPQACYRGSFFWVSELCSLGAPGYVHLIQREETRVSGLGALLRGQTWRPGCQRVYRESAQIGEKHLEWCKAKGRGEGGGVPGCPFLHLPFKAYSRLTSFLPPRPTLFLLLHWLPTTPSYPTSCPGPMPRVVGRTLGRFWVYTFSKLLNQTLIQLLLGRVLQI